MKNIIYFSFVLLLLQSCNKKNTIVHENDYKVFLNKKFVQYQLNKNQAEINFWTEKLKQDTGSFLIKMEIGINLLSHFKLTGMVQDLKNADSLFLNSAAKLNHTEASNYFALAQNAITQHQFKTAEKYLNSAEKCGAESFTVSLVKFDISMELGKYILAEKCLNEIAARGNSFDFLIRKAKFEDHKGNAENSILEMEKAYALVEKVNKKSLKNWVMTNLADMYSHSGRIRDAYDMYVLALQNDSANLYALKGIANIAFVQDHNTAAAENIYKFILSTTEAPDLYLNLAEICAWKKDNNKSAYYEQVFLSKVNKPEYGNMYNKYKIDLYLKESGNQKAALEIAENEINNRATPETFTWLALANYKMQRFEKAKNIIESKVLYQTKEPDALFASAIILHKTNPELSKEMVRQCEQSAFELGPLKMEQLKHATYN